MFVCLSVGVLVSSHARVFTHTSACLVGIFGAHVRSAIKSLSNRFFHVSQQFFFPTMIANDTKRITLEATNVPVSKLTRSATHVSNNQASFQPLDSGDPSTLLCLARDLFLPVPRSSASPQPAHQSAQNSSLKHYIIIRRSFTHTTP